MAVFALVAAAVAVLASVSSASLVVLTPSNFDSVLPTQEKERERGLSLLISTLKKGG